MNSERSIRVYAQLYYTLCFLGFVMERHKYVAAEICVTSSLLAANLVVLKMNVYYVDVHTYLCLAFCCLRLRFQKLVRRYVNTISQHHISTHNFTTGVPVRMDQLHVNQ